MNIFAFTRIKLTAWYVTAIMLVSIMFSFVIYQGVTQNIEDVFFRAEMRMRNTPALSKQVVKQIIEQQSVSDSTQPINKQEILEEFFDEEVKLSKRKVSVNLIYANSLILLLSTIISFVLANKTLDPIKEVLLEQKRFIADASHELRTPLTSLKTSIEVSLRDKTLNKKAKKVLKENLEDVDALKDLIDSLLQLASQENKTVVKQLIDIHEVMNRSIKTVKPLADNKKIKIVSKLQHRQILASEVGLNQLFTILLDNAVKYSNKGGKINVTIKCKKKCVFIKVTDQGVGINKKYLTNIFDRFYRIDASRTISQRPGFGLGLSVAKQVVQNHNGSISVYSEIGTGSTFVVKLPA